MDEFKRPRKPAFAAAMSLMLPGFGQMYNGELDKAIWLFIAFALLSGPGLVLIALYLPAGVTLPVLVIAVMLTIGIWVYATVDAWRSARRKRDYALKPWQMSSVYALTLLVCDGVALPMLVDYVRERQVASFRIPSTSMEPSVLAGDVLFADMRYNCPACKGSVQRGDIAIFTYPNNRTQRYIKRVIALPGDRVRIRGRSIWVNDKPLTLGETHVESGLLVTEAIDGRRWQVRWTGSEAPLPEQEVAVPPGHALVLGDNRSATTDSRNFGPVPLQDIVGKARQVWFSAWAGEGIRWHRMGKVLE